MSRRTRHTGPVGGPCAGQSAGWDTDRSNSTESFPPVDVQHLLDTLPQVLALSDTGRIGTGFARLEHLEPWLAIEEEDIFPTAEKVALIEAITPFMDENTLLANAIAAYVKATS